MSTYAANPAGIGVGKRFGPLNPGGVKGVFRGEGSERELIYELTAGEMVNGVPFTYSLPANYRVEEIYLEVETAFAASSTVNFTIGGGVALTTPISLATAQAVTSVALTGLTNLSHVDAKDLVLVANANAIASATGNARLMIRFKAL